MQLLQRVDTLERENAPLREESAKLKLEIGERLPQGKEQLLASKRATAPLFKGFGKASERKSGFNYVPTCNARRKKVQ